MGNGNHMGHSNHMANGMRDGGMHRGGGRRFDRDDRRFDRDDRHFRHHRFFFAYAPYDYPYYSPCGYPYYYHPYSYSYSYGRYYPPGYCPAPYGSPYDHRGGYGGTDDGQYSGQYGDQDRAQYGASPPTVILRGTAFSPSRLTAKVGQDVVWSWNDDGVAHTVTADDGSFDSGRMTTGTFRHTFDRPGEFTYHCQIHPQQMTGTIVVSQ
jgi:plastocyanin